MRDEETALLWVQETHSYHVYWQSEQTRVTVMRSCSVETTRADEHLLQAIVEEADWNAYSGKL
jgi:hypothetical protein